MFVGLVGGEVALGRGKRASRLWNLHLHTSTLLSHAHLSSPPLPWPVHARTPPASPTTGSPQAPPLSKESCRSALDAMQCDAMRCDATRAVLASVDPEHSKRLREPLVGCDRSRKYPPRINGQHRVDTEPTLLGDDVSTLGAGHILIHMLYASVSPHTLPAGQGDDFEKIAGQSRRRVRPRLCQQTEDSTLSRSRYGGLAATPPRPTLKTFF
jgi:hypothetical protein